MVLEIQQIDGLAQELAGLHPADIIKRAQQEYGEDLAISFRDRKSTRLNSSHLGSRMPSSA